MDPASIAFAALAEEFRRVGRHEEAIEACRSGLQRHPAYLSARVTLGRALIETGEYDAARDELETVLRSAPENLAAIRGLAQIHERLGQSTEMDPHLAAMMNAEVERVALAAATAASAPAAVAEPDPAPPVQIAAPVPVTVPVSIPVTESVPVTVPVAESVPVTMPVTFTVPVPVPEAALIEVEEEREEEDPAGPDPAMLATLARLERFLVAIDAARHP